VKTIVVAIAIPPQLSIGQQSHDVHHLGATILYRIAYRTLHKRIRCKIHRAEGIVPIETNHMQAKWIPFENRSDPNTYIPIKFDSRKKASSTSMASGAPKTSPTKREKSDQFMPN